MINLVVHIAQKEFTEALRDSRFRLISGFLVGLLLFSMLVSWNYYQKTAEEFKTAQGTARQQWENQPMKNPHSAAHFGTFAFKPVPTLALIDNGLDKYLGISVFLEAHRQNTAQYKQIADQNDLARFAELTPAFVFTYLFPLLIILLAFQAFTIEKERDTLRLLLSQGIPIQTLAWGKVLGLVGLLALILLPVWSLGLIFLLFSDCQTDDILRYVLLCGLLAVYYAVFVQVSMTVSAWAKNGNVALLTLLGFWVISTFLVPKLLANVSKNLYPTPSAIAYQTQIKEALEKGIDGHNPFSERSKIFEDSVLKANKVDSIHKLPFNYSGLIMQTGEEHETVVYAKAMKKLNDIYMDQLNAYSASAFFSPTILVKMLSMQLSKTDLLSHYDFAQQAENYRIALVRNLNYDLKDHAKYGDWEYKPADKDFFKKTVDFSYQPISLATTLEKAWLSIGFLLVWWGLSVVGLIVISKNYITG